MSTPHRTRCLMLKPPEAYLYAAVPSKTRVGPVRPGGLPRVGRWPGPPRRACRCERAAVVEVLQLGFAAMLDVVSVQHSHDGGHGHSGRGREHDHDHRAGPGRRPGSATSAPALTRHADKVDAALEASAEGIRALWMSLVVLRITALSRRGGGPVRFGGITGRHFAQRRRRVDRGAAADRVHPGRRPPNSGTPMATAGPRTWPGSSS